MTRAQLTTLLTYAVQHDWITANEARTILQRFNAGDLPPSSLPLPLQEALGAGLSSEQQYMQAVVALLALGSADWLFRIRQASIRATVREKLQDRYMEQVRTLVEQTPAPQVWHRSMRDLLTTYLVGMTVLGLNRPTLPATERARLLQTIGVQLTFLYQFAGQVAMQAQTTHPLTPAQIGARAELYAGAGRETWFRANEQDTTDGYVYRYIAVDDANTCPNCVRAEYQGPYLPADGPYPGTVCFGMGRCRCRREGVYDLPAWQALQQDNQRRASVLAANV